MTNHLLTWRSAPPRRHWTVRGLAAWLAIALGAASLVFVTPAVRAAVSYNNGFINFTDTGATSMSYGPNETVEIALGQIHYLASSGCPSNGLADFITPIADIYVIPVGELAGLVADGDLKAHTPTHFPSAVAKAASDGSFWGTTIGFTYPSGALHTGEYAVVYDECQDGRLGSEDDVFSPVPGYPQGASDTGGFSVSIPAHVPLLPLAAITATKEAARLRAVDMSRVYAGTQIAFIISKWLDVSSVGGDTADKVMYWGMGFLGDSVANDPMEAAQNAIVSQIRLHTAIWKDPPDPNFEQPAGLPGRGAVLQNEADPFDAALAAVGQAGENEASIAQALLDAVQRYQGAAEAGDGTWALAHAREVRNFALALGDQLVDSSAASASFSSVVSAKATALDARSSEYAALRARLASDGFTDAEVQGLRNRGLSAAQVDQMLHAIAEGPAPVSSADLLAALAAGQADAAQAATAMTGLASAMNATIASLAGDVDVDPLAPSLSAGGPYTATAGSPATFTATGSDPVGIASYAWDLGSGTFADATGPIVSRTFAQAFDGWVGVEATDTVGRRSRSYAHVHVTGGNMPPRVTATTPSPAIVTVVENQTRDLSVSTSDTENDTVSVEWFVDNVATGATGLSYHYAPGTTHGGVHAIDAVVTDAGHPERGSSIARFAVSVTKPDADNDGWTSSSDCDDHDPATHPGLPEILFTGAVDACDLGAVDFPAGSAVAVSAPSSVQAGTWATVTAAVTALGASPAGAHVALQVSGAQNWALNATANANGIATFAYVAVLPGVDNYVATITGRGGDGATRSASSPSASTTITHIGPNPPRNLVATGDAGAAKLTWQAPVPNAFTVHGYEVTLTDPADPAHPAVHFVSPTQDTFTGLVNGTTYGVSIVARDLVAVRDSPPVTTNVTVMSHVPASATVSPPAQWNPKGRTVHVAATVNNGGGTPLPSVDLHFEIAGRNSQSGNVATGADGVATYSYTDTGAVGASDQVTMTVVGTAISGTATLTWVEPIVLPADHGALIGVASSRDRLLVSRYDCLHRIDAVDESGVDTLFAMLPYSCSESYLAVSPGLGGFRPREVFAVQGASVLRISADGSSVTPFADIGEASEGITFDEVGSFGYRLIVTSTSGNAFALTAAGAISKIGQFPASPSEGPAIAPLSFTSAPGHLLTADENSGTVWDMDAAGSVKKFADVPAAEAVHIIPATVCSFGTTGSSWFAAEPWNHSLVPVPASAFAGHAGAVLVTSEYSGNVTLFESTPAGLTTRLMATGMTQVEGSAFTDCSVPTTTELRVPGPPTNLSAPTVDGALTVSWGPPLVSGSTAVDRYRATISLGGAEMGTVVATDLASLHAAFAGLVNGQTYSVTVTAHNRVGWGPPAAVDATPQAPALVRTLPSGGPVVTLAATAPTNSALAADFAPSIVDADAAITSWTLMFGDGAQATGAGKPPPWVRHTYPAAGVYLATLAATDGLGRSGSNVATAVVVAITVANLAPTIVAATTTSGVVGAAFDAPASAAGPEAGDRVEVTAAGLPPGLTFPAHAVGTGSVVGHLSGVPTTAGVFTVTISAADGHNPVVTATTTVTVSAERVLHDCTLSAPPATFGTSSSPTPLSATLADANATPASVAAKAVSFTATDAGSATFGPYAGSTDSLGVASTSVRWAANVYEVAATFDGDTTFRPCATSFPVIVTVAAAQAKATGGGWISNGSGRVSFGFNAINDVTGMHGQLQVRAANKSTFHGTTVDSLAGTATSARWSGLGSWNGAPSYRYTVAVTDGVARAKAGDTISLTVTAPGGAVVLSTNGPSPLKGGTIVVH